MGGVFFPRAIRAREVAERRRLDEDVAGEVFVNE